MTLKQLKDYYREGELSFYPIRKREKNFLPGFRAWDSKMRIEILVPKHVRENLLTSNELSVRTLTDPDGEDFIYTKSGLTYRKIVIFIANR